MGKNANAGKVTSVFSPSLFKQDLRSNIVLIVVVLALMVLISNVVNIATHVLSESEQKTTEAQEQAQEDFFVYLSGLAAYDAMSGQDLSFEDFEATSDHEPYETAFSLVNDSLDLDEELSVEGFEDVIGELEGTDVSLDTYVELFEYNYALAQQEGAFTGDELDMEGFMTAMLEVMGIPSDFVDTVSELDTTSLLNRMYFTVTGLLPIFVLIIVLTNSLVASRVDRGSMAYLLSTPTKRCAVMITQIAFLVLIPLLVVGFTGLQRGVSTQVLFGDVVPERVFYQYLGLYLLTEALCGICFLGSCFANRSSHALAFGGGFVGWFFLASLLGMFGSGTLLDMGIGVEQLDIFNHLTIISLFNVEAIQAVGTMDTDLSFLGGFVVLGAIAVVTYLVGAVRFCKKDLPL